MPNAYSENITVDACAAKKAPEKTIYTGMRALQDMSGVTNMVMKRLLVFSIVRVAITAGTLQPNPMSKEMKDLPCSPMRFISGSANMAARAR